MSRRRHLDLATGLAAAAGLLLLVAGTPAALVSAIGWPLPRTAPQLDTVLVALRYGQIAPSTLLQALAVVAWLTWATIVISVTAEVVAVVRGTVARTLPGLAPVQHLAARLVATVMLVSSITTRAVAEPPPPVPAAAWPPAEAGAAAGSATSAPDQAPSDGAWWTVRRHDSLWTIAERVLGDGHRWKEIAARNVGRPQPDGGRLRQGDTLIRPGWRLALPADATMPRRTGQVTVVQGDDLWGLAEAHLGDGERWREIFVRNRGRRQPGGGRLEDPDVIRPGWVLHLPADQHAAPSSQQVDEADRPTARERRREDGQRRQPSDVTDRPGGPPMDAPRAGAAPAAERRTDPDDVAGPPVAPPVTPRTLPGPVGRPDHRPDASGVDGRGSAGSSPSERLDPARLEATRATRNRPRALAPVATAVLAAALVGLLAHRRRHWLRRREPGIAPAAADAEAAELERWLRSMADHDLTTRIDRVLCALAEHLDAHGSSPRVRLAEFGEDVVLHLTAPLDDPPACATATHGGERWVLAPELEMAPSEGGRRHVPALISCGRAASGALVLLDPTAVHGLGVTGDDGPVLDAMTSWTAELAATGAVGGVDLVVVGQHHPLVERFARVSVAADGAAAVARVQAVIDDADSTDGSVVVLCGAGVHATHVRALMDAAAHPRVGVVVAAHTGTADHLELLDGEVRLRPDGRDLAAPAWLTPDDWDRFGDLLQPADGTNVLGPVPAALRAVADDTVPASEALHEPPTHQIEVLGPLRIDGGPPALDADAIEILTWLAVRRTGGDPATLAGLAPSVAAHGDAGVHAAVARIDAALAVDGSPTVIVHTDDGRIELRDTVASDLARCTDLLRGLDRRPPAAQARVMYTALELVRGEPFVNGSAWAHADGTALRTTGMLIDVAHRLAMQSLTIGDVDRATWAVERGLLAAPTNELLHRDRMRIADMAGDAAAIDDCMHRLRVRVEADGGWLTPETEALYRELRGGAGPDLEQDAS